MPAQKKSKKKIVAAPTEVPVTPIDIGTSEDVDEYYEDKDIEKGEVGETDATEDIYNDEQREEMLQDGEISAEESAFMEGQEMAMGKGEDKRRKKTLSKSEHEDTPPVELAKLDAKEGEEPGGDTETT